MITTIKAAQAIAGTLGNPSKMPGKSYGLPAAAAPWVPAACADMGLDTPPAWGCPIGAKLAAIKGTTCSACYANNRGNYQYSSVRKAQAKRAVGVHHPDWVDAMVFLIEKRVSPNDPYFRWHDSGDILDVWHLEKIAEVARRTPWVSHWLPTREQRTVREYLERNSLPQNLTIRVSSHKVDARPLAGYPISSTVHQDKAPHGHVCPAPTQDNECKDCRACWSRLVQNVSYHVH